MKDLDTDKCISRRQLLVGGGKLAGVGGVAAVSVGSLGLLAGCGSSSTETKTESSAAMTAELPWPYEKFDASDIKQAQETAHDNWFTGFCTFAVLSGIISVLREKVGGPYDQFPVEAFNFAHGGTAGWGATCGTLIGAGIAASLATGHAGGEEITNEVIRYYSDTELPIYVPDNPKAQITAVSKSDTLVCHISVGRWMEKEGVGFLSAEQMERCGRLSADVAKKTVELINSYIDGTFEAPEKAPAFSMGMPAQTNCTDCHGENVPTIPTPGGGEDLLAGH
ncbi:MAG TPA: C_GCAxxG_C_C family protein [Actinobacteria bacterium]|nr:C_GCAxxG_C_C family protein [Actinomycetota bacterium]